MCQYGHCAKCILILMLKLIKYNRATDNLANLVLSLSSIIFYRYYVKQQKVSKSNTFKSQKQMSIVTVTVDSGINKTVTRSNMSHIPISTVPAPRDAPGVRDAG